MTLNKIDLSVVLPSYREGDNLSVLLPNLSKTLDNLKIRYEILVIDTIEPLDNTPEICSEFSEVKYIPRKNGNSFGDAVRTGIDECVGKKIIFMDADGSHPPELISELYQHSSDYDVVLASRYVDEGKTENSRHLILMSQLLNWTYSFVLNLPCKDVSNSFKLYRSKDLKKLKLTCNNFDIVEEILYKVFCSNSSITYKEVPFTFKKRQYGETKRNLWVFIITYVFTIVRLRFTK